MRTAHETHTTARETHEIEVAFLHGFLEELARHGPLEEVLFRGENRAVDPDEDSPWCVDWTKRW
jgi:hypothetical protein